MVLKTLSYLSESKFSKWFPKFKEEIEGIEDRYCQRWEYAGPAKFEEWAQSLTHSSGENLNTNKYCGDYVKQLRKAPDSDSITNWIIEQGMSRNTNIMIINDSISKVYFLDFGQGAISEKEPQDLELDSCHFGTLNIQKQSIDLTIRNAIIKNIVISKGKINLKFENCCIGKIDFHPGEKSIIIQHSWIGNINFHPSSIHNLLIKGGWICSITGPATYETNPFRGSVDFKNVKLPTSKENSILFKGAQQYRNLRVHFENLQNGPMAGLMRAKELASERESDSGVSWFFNWVYCIASGYGQRPERAIIWFFVFLIINIIILTYADGVTVDSKLTKGAWQLEWQGDDLPSQLGRASILTFQTVINPFTIFVAKSTFKFNSLWATIQTFFLVLLADTAFIFGSLAIRKRLKFS